MAARLGQQLVFSGRARLPHSAQNSPTGRRNLLIRGSRYALLKLRRAIAGEDEMRVGVDEAGRDAVAVRRRFRWFPAESVA